MAQSSEKPGVEFKTETGKVCGLNDLQGEVHYTFNCRCGCGAVFAGYGKDIKSVARIESSEVSQEVTAADVELIMKVRPFVSDRFIQKAIFKLSDDEIDAMAAKRAEEGKMDPVIEHGGGAEGNDPPEVGSTVYSKVTRDGPFTVADFTMGRIKVGEGDLAQVHQTWCGVLRTAAGDYINVPVGDLVKTLPALAKSDSLSPRARSLAKREANRKRSAKRFVMTLMVLLLGWSGMATAVALYLAYIWG